MRRGMMIGRISRRFSERSGNSACLLVYYRFVFLEELKSMLLSVIFLIFISLGLPDSLLGSGWPIMQKAFAVPSSYAGYVSMSISFMTILSALVSPRMIRRFRTQWIVIVSILLTVIGLIGFSFSTSYWMLFLFVVPYGLGAGAIDASVNHYGSTIMSRATILRRS